MTILSLLFRFGVAKGFKYSSDNDSISNSARSPSSLAALLLKLVSIVGELDPDVRYAFDVLCD